MTGSSERPSQPTGPRTGSGRSDREARAAARTRALFAYDRGFDTPGVAGADEAGRGCLAGPLVAAAVLFDSRDMPRARRRALNGLDDSKRLSRAERGRLYGAIHESAAAVSVVVVAPEQIDRKGVHRCNLEALGEALRRVLADSGGRGGEPALAPPTCLVDGYRLEDCEISHTEVVRGDGKSAAIAAASVIAKETRDRMMREAHRDHPGWGFDAHVGYGTAAHLDAIRELGVSPLHRLSFNCGAYPQSAGA